MATDSDPEIQAGVTQGQAPKPRRSKADVDWDAVERVYRTGRKSDAEIARLFGNKVTPQAIGKRARKEGWTRDLTEVVRHAARAEVVQREVLKDVQRRAQREVGATVNLVQFAANVGAEVVMRHRAATKDLDDLIQALRGELWASTLRQDELVAMFRRLVVDNEDMDTVERAHLANRFRDMLRIHERVGSVSRLAEAMNKQQAMERKAYDLDDDDSSGSFESVLERVLEEPDADTPRSAG